MRKRSLCCRPVSVRPSVRLSVTLVYCIHTAEDIVKLLSRPGSPYHSSYLTPGADTQFQGEPLQRGRKIHGVGWKRFAIFDWNCRLSRKRYEIGPWLQWNVNRKSHALYRMVAFQWPWRNPNPVFKVTDIWSRISLRDKVTIERK